MSDAFLRRDPIEEYLGVGVEEMTRWQLVSYVKNGLRALYGIDLMAEGYQEPSIMQWLQKTYGTTDAGRIVKWVCWKYYLRDQGRPVVFTSFSKGRKWWIDMMHAEMQAQVAKELEGSTATNDALWLLEH